MSCKQTHLAHFQEYAHPAEHPEIPNVFPPRNVDLSEAFDHPFYEGELGQGLETYTVHELRIMEYEGIIRNKPNWFTKIENSEIVAKWVKELEEEDLNASEIKYILDELLFQASKVENGVCASGVDGVYHSDQAIDLDLKCKFISEASVLEELPDHLKDWHPGSNQQVLNLVHPSLFCFVWGKTSQAPQTNFENWIGSGEVYPAPRFIESRGNKSFGYSRKYQWLPSEFSVGADGKVSIRSYINNLHPEEHSNLYKSIEEIFARFVPLFNRVLDDHHAQRPRRVHIASEDMYDVYTHEEEDGEENYEFVLNLPEEMPIFEPPIVSRSVPPIDLKGRDLQVIVKLANVVLTPENPTYPGGSWHVEGMRNEEIVATGIYYYQNENITDSFLQFRAAVCEPEYEQHDERGVEAAYGLTNEGPLNQSLGYIFCREDRCVAFPNLYQHRLDPFELIDKSKPGVRKILVFFLVNPGKPIISTATVPPQQASWYHKEIARLSGLSSVLPSELQEAILSFVNFPMSLYEAKLHREELMKERKFFVQQHNDVLFERHFSLCEH
jgi:hypothetical protein